jgi:oxygen-independent coproporphyrinogen-3 oxidase
MAGIYIHIPFCKQACHYCNFHFSTNRRTKAALLAALQAELSMQENYLEGQPTTTIYIGGGTPSLLEMEEIASLLAHVQQVFPYQEVVEITLEANPDDITPARLREWRSLGINRLSLGIQSFQDTLLAYLNRVHDASKATESIAIAQAAGFETINIDLIYAIPGQTLALLQKDLEIALAHRPQHIAAYCLTLEPHTVFGRWLEAGRMQPVSEDLAAEHFIVVSNTLTSQGYEHYEVSNFCLPSHYALHNTNYWKKGSYLGIGPGAHSYNGQSRQYNVAHNHHYIQHIQAGKLPCTIEVLQPSDHINEYLLTSLRTTWGCNLAFLRAMYNHTLPEHHWAYVQQLIAHQLAFLANEVLVLTTRGKLLADKIAADLFVDK